MEITEELLQLIEDRARAFAIAKFGNEPDKIQLSGGSLTFEYESYCCGSYETEYEYAQASDLSKDLDVVIEERKKELERKQEEEKIRKARLEEETKKKKDLEDFNKYQELKRKFDGKIS